MARAGRGGYGAGMDADAAVRGLFGVRHASDGLAWALQHAPEGEAEGGLQAVADRAWRECRDVELMARLAGARGVGFRKIGIEAHEESGARLLAASSQPPRRDVVLTLETFGGARIELRVSNGAHWPENAALVRAVVPKCPVRFDALPGARAAARR